MPALGLASNVWKILDPPLTVSVQCALSYIFYLVSLYVPLPFCVRASVCVWVRASVCVCVCACTHIGRQWFGFPLLFHVEAFFVPVSDKSVVGVRTFFIRTSPTELSELGCVCTVCPYLRQTWNMKQPIKLVIHRRLITARIQRMREGNSFTLCVSYPIPGLDGGWGVVSHPRSRLGGVPHPCPVGEEYPIRSNVHPPAPIRRQISITSTCYAAGGMPLAFMQDDFLVCIKVWFLSWTSD